MRKPFQDNLDNSLQTMFNSNRDYINQEINRLASVSARETNYIRGGTLYLGARQMVNFTGETYAVAGANLTSPIVGR